RFAYLGAAGRPPTGSATTFWAASTVALSLVAAGLLALLMYVMKKNQTTAMAAVRNVQ
ncbi:MAG: hypothetical protein JWQ72_3367, partial [Polaromonas sp.]|nr:hypothetical protein [Polaromonas sp.]